MQFDLLSDPHFPFWKPNADLKHILNPQSDTLVLAGDIAEANTILYWLEKLSNIYKTIIAVPGNHDYYKGNVQIQNQLFANHKLTNVHILNGNYIDLDGVRFIGACGWYDWLAFADHRGVTRDRAQFFWNKNSNDARQIIYQNPPDIMAEQDANAFIEIVDNTDSPMVLITHTAPHRDLLKYLGFSDWDNFSPSYCNTLMEQVWNLNIKYWCYGHCHDRKMVTLDNGITYVNNSYGYPHESQNWKPVFLSV